MKRASVVLDEKLIDDCMKATGITTQKALINHALRKLLRHERQKKILELKGNTPDVFLPGIPEPVSCARRTRAESMNLYDSAIGARVGVDQ